MFDDEETIGGLTMAEQGDEPVVDYENPADVARLIQTQAQNREKYFNDLAEQLKAKRYGPSRAEQLFALSAAFASPTATRGFGGVMGNVMPVFQQFEKAKRDAEEARAADMQKLTLARMGTTDDAIKNALTLQRLQATYNKPKSYKSVVAGGPTGALDPKTGQPITAPTPKAYLDLENNPTPENLAAMIEAYPRFDEQFTMAYNRGLKKYGVR
jgi:hypothetical protein